MPASVIDDMPRRFDKVILLFVDGFGWRFFERYADKYPFLSRFKSEGIVSKLTSQFRSTTAAHTTTIHTGLPVGESGVFEWFYYEPQLDRIIAPLLYSFAGDKGRETLRKAKITPEALFPQQNLYRRLLDQGVQSYAFQHRDYTPSPFSDVVLAGAHVSPYKTLSEALINLSDAVIGETQRAYFYLYFDGIDTIGHIYGPSSRQFDAEVDTFFTALERLLHDSLNGRLRNTRLLITADHGQIEVSPDTTIYLNRQVPSLATMIKVNRQGDLLVPAGSARDMFLYILDERLDEAHALLAQQLAGHADVCYVRDLIEQGMFGPRPPSETFLKRVGNLVILPYKHETVWWYEKGKHEQNFFGHHGGLTREEMETPLLALSY